MLPCASVCVVFVYFSCLVLNVLKTIHHYSIPIFMVVFRYVCIYNTSTDGIFLNLLLHHCGA